MRSSTGVRIAGALFVLGVGAAGAAPVPTGGTTKIVIKDNATASKRKAVFLTKAINITIPSPDPATTGATMQFLNPATAQTSSVWNMPAGGWACTPGKVCKYKDKTLANGPVLTAVLKPGDGVKKNGLFKAVVKGAGMDYELIGQGSQGHVGVVVTMGTGGVCTLVPEQAATAKKDDPVKGQFIAARTKGVPADGSCPVVTFLDFTTSAPDLSGCVSGSTKDASMTVLKTLHCGGLNIGGGPSTVAEGGIPEGSTARFGATCSGSTCTLHPTSAAGPGFECTNTGCNFGAPLPISNLGTSTCVLNTFQSPGGGIVDTTLGSVSLVAALNSDVFLTGNATAPCPRCISGMCERGPNAGGGCTTTNSFNTSKDCAPDGTELGNIFVNLTPLHTGTTTTTDAGGLFCPGQSAKPGCFGSASCVEITESGISAGAITLNGPAAPLRLGYVFCIPETPGMAGLIINFAAGLPGPGATSLPGPISLHN